MDKIEKKQEEIMGQLSKILELISTDKGKKVAGSSGTPEDVQQTETNTDPVYPPGFTPPPVRNASIPMPSVGQYPFFGMPIGPPPTYAQQRPIGGASPSDPIFVPDLDDPKEQEKLKCGSFESKDNPDTHKKFDLFEERLRMVEGMGMYCSMDAIELCLVLDVVIPPKFKVPDFEKLPLKSNVVRLKPVMGEDRGALLVRVDDSEERFGNLSSVHKLRSAYRVPRAA
ncbi:Uncharacterized protein TCM_038513 [Theobroma cacao]|uniref:Uncharacterized protein n=1 Tax=Theobroma cacao TaxID=3641 RepID=A0A061GWU2_THECC|nr:Uncharacterized protein TCM_038513 [Theobroma cacao]